MEATQEVTVEQMLLRLESILNDADADALISMLSYMAGQREAIGEDVYKAMRRIILMRLAVRVLT